MAEFSEKDLLPNTLKMLEPTVVPEPKLLPAGSLLPEHQNLSEHESPLDVSATPEEWAAFQSTWHSPEIARILAIELEDIFWSMSLDLAHKDETALEPMAMEFLQCVAQRYGQTGGPDFRHFVSKRLIEDALVELQRKYPVLDKAPSLTLGSVVQAVREKVRAPEVLADQGTKQEGLLERAFLTVAENQTYFMPLQKEEPATETDDPTLAELAQFLDNLVMDQVFQHWDIDSQDTSARVLRNIDLRTPLATAQLLNSVEEVNAALTRFRELCQIWANQKGHQPDREEVLRALMVAKKSRPIPDFANPRYREIWHHFQQQAETQLNQLVLYLLMINDQQWQAIFTAPLGLTAEETRAEEATQLFDGSIYDRVLEQMVDRPQVETKRRARRHHVFMMMTALFLGAVLGSYVHLNVGVSKNVTAEDRGRSNLDEEDEETETNELTPSLVGVTPSPSPTPSPTSLPPTEVVATATILRESNEVVATSQPEWPADTSLEAWMVSPDGPYGQYQPQTWENEKRRIFLAFLRGVNVGPTTPNWPTVFDAAYAYWQRAFPADTATGGRTELAQIVFNGMYGGSETLTTQMNDFFEEWVEAYRQDLEVGGTAHQDEVASRYRWGTRVRGINDVS